MSRDIAKAFFDPGPGEPQTGYITPADQQAAIDEIYDDMGATVGYATPGAGWNANLGGPRWTSAGRLVAVVATMGKSGTPASGEVIASGFPPPDDQTFVLAANGPASTARLYLTTAGELKVQFPTADPDYTMTFTYLAAAEQAQLLPAPDPDPTPEQHEEDR